MKGTVVCFIHSTGKFIGKSMNWYPIMGCEKQGQAKCLRSCLRIISDAVS